MNFFGHAVLAVRHCADPAFVLGAMLPDFATMIRARPPLTEHAAIDLGMRFHWRTDDAFHRSGAFGNHTHEAVTWLSARGVRSGSALAAAHVGVEILLDAALAHDAPGQQAYLAALNGAAPGELGRHVAWASDEQIMRFDRLRERLLERGPIVSDIAPEVVAERLRRALADRPRLALDAAAELAVRDWVSVARAQISDCAVPLIEELTTQLAVLARPN
ncbi:MAG: hypothetical protein DME04_22690 [Candidatus Rokuibacteriota bacterium]|nr:MAG: hypothetical protein DME04_22690 [Candidatus Rokubacteria bacterium]